MSSDPPPAGRRYRGVRCKSKKWVSEIREPRTTTRIWLGTFPTPEMAAIAYDVAARAFKGDDAIINFPSLAPTYPQPPSLSPADICVTAAAAAATAMAPPREAEQMQGVHVQASENASEFVDEEALFDMPQLLVDMAEGMLLSPPPIKSAAADDYSGIDSLWSYPFF